MMNGLQLFVYMPLMNVKFPANANTFIIFLVEIANFDVLPTDALFAEIFDFPEDGSFNMNFETTGLESYYAIENLGTVFLIFNIYVVLSILQLIGYCFKNKVKWCKKMSKKIGKFLYWGGILRLLMEGFLETIICTMLNLRVMSKEWDNVTIAYSIQFSVVMTLLLVLLPVWSTIFYWKNRNKWEDDDWDEKWGAPLEGLEKAP